MKAASFDPAKRLDLYFRCNRSGDKNFVFTNSNGSARSLIYEEFAFNIYQNQGERKVYITLPLAYNQNTLTASITKALSNINEGEYYYELYNVDTEKTWLCGDAIFHNGKFDGVTETTGITVSECGDDVVITVDGEYLLSVSTQTSTATLTPDGITDAYALTAQNEPLTIANPSTDYANFDGFISRIYTAGAETLTMGNKYRAIGDAFPATTEAGKIMIVTSIFDSATDMYDTRISFQV